MTRRARAQKGKWCPETQLLHQSLLHSSEAAVSIQKPFTSVEEHGEIAVTRNSVVKQTLSPASPSGRLGRPSPALQDSLEQGPAGRGLNASEREQQKI